MKKELKLGVDFYFACQVDRRGIGNYSYNLYKKLADMRRITLVIFVPKSAILNELDFPEAQIVRMPCDNYLINENIIIPILGSKLKLDYVHFTANAVPPLSLFFSYKVCATIHDTMFLDFRFSSLARMPQLFARLYRATTLRLLGPKLHKVFTVSNYSANRIASELPAISNRKICVTYQGVGEEFIEPFEEERFRSDQVLDIFEVNERYFFALSASEPRKNLVGLLHSYRKYLEIVSVENRKVKLVLAGLDERAQIECRSLCENLGIYDNVIIHGYVTRHQLVWFYKNAVAFIFISTEEGFGIPLLEAFSARCPVICSRTTSLGEIAGNAAILVDPLSVDEVATAMNSVLSSSVQEDLVKRGLTRAWMFSWDNAAECFLSGLSQ